MGSRKQEVPRVDEGRINSVRQDIKRQNQEMDAQISSYSIQAKQNMADSYKQADNSISIQRGELVRQRGLLQTSRVNTLTSMQSQQVARTNQNRAQGNILADQSNTIREQRTQADFRLKGNLERRKGKVNSGITY